MANVNEMLGQELKRLGALQTQLKEKREHFRKELMATEDALIRADACFRHTASLIQALAKDEEKAQVAPVPAENNTAQ